MKVYDAILADDKGNTIGTIHKIVKVEDLREFLTNKGVDGKQYWAKANTKNCVWLFERSYVPRTSDELIPDAIDWFTERVFLKEEEAFDYGSNGNYGQKDISWRIYGVPCEGIMPFKIDRYVELLALLDDKEVKS